MRNIERFVTYSNLSNRRTTIGGSPYLTNMGLHGGIAELIVFDKADDHVRMEITNYLLNKYIVSTCGQYGTVYLSGDLNRDCNVDFFDIVTMAEKWLESFDFN